MPLIHTFLIVIAVSAIAVADIFLKKTQALGSMSKAIASPWMFAAVTLYIVQILLFTYLFISGAKLTHVGIVQTVLYALIVLLAGVFIFGETLSPIHIVGIILALIGVALLNL